jgi:hypothetical protein
MSYLSAEQHFNSSVPTGLNASFLNTKLQQWSLQIDQLTLNTFKNNTNKNKVIKVKSNQKKINIGGWQKTGLTINLKLIGSATQKLLIENTDFTFIYPDFDSINIEGNIIEPPIIGLDFSCLTCFDCCEQIIINGNKSWSNVLPSDLYSILVELLENEIKINTSSWLDGINPNINNLKSEQDEGGSASYFVDEKNITNQNNMSSKGVNYKYFEGFLYKYAMTAFNNNLVF